MAGGAGNDFYFFNTDLVLGSDTINEAGGGTDTLDFSQTNFIGVDVNLGSAFAQIVNANLTLILSAGNTIENAIGGSLDDTLIGNSLANTLTGGAGDDALSGLEGNDTLTGNDGKSVLLGGFGADTLNGGTSEDMLLGASYRGEADIVALYALRAEWTSVNTITDLARHLLGVAGGVNNGFNLNRSSVLDDYAADILFGAMGADWYIRQSSNTVVNVADTTVKSGLDSVFTDVFLLVAP